MTKFLNTFRGKLLLVLAILLILTLGVQLYFNYLDERRNAELREMQEKALVAGITLGFNGMQSEDRMQEFVDREGQKIFSEEIKERVADIIIINSDWEVYDSLSDKYLPDTDTEGNPINKKLEDLKDLPRLVDPDNLSEEDRKRFPNSDKPENELREGEVHAVPIETNQGRWYVLVVLKSHRASSIGRIVQPVVYTFSILLISFTILVLLVWRFTRPIADLSKAARRVAEGDLQVRLRDADRTDEIGRLASQFNEMTAELEKTRELESQLQQAEKSAVVGRLASAIAHEIRNPLNYINLTLDHLRAKFLPEMDEEREQYQKLTSQLKTEVERINRQISEFLHYSRPPKLNLRPVEVRKIINDSLRLVEVQSEDQDIKISVVEREDIPEVFGDSEVLRSVFNNLFLNAAQSMKNEGGNLNVTLSTFDDYVKIEVKDTGEGIPEENLDKIFEPYFSTKDTGTGLGLAIVKKILDDHKGLIDVESEENVGTTFTVRLPKA